MTNDQGTDRTTAARKRKYPWGQEAPGRRARRLLKALERNVLRQGELVRLALETADQLARLSHEAAALVEHLDLPTDLDRVQAAYAKVQEDLTQMLDVAVGANERLDSIAFDLLRRSADLGVAPYANLRLEVEQFRRNAKRLVDLLEQERNLALPGDVAASEEIPDDRGAANHR